MPFRNPFEWLTVPGQKRMFVVSAVLAAVVMASLQVLGVPLRTPAAPASIVSYELAGSLARAQEMIASWGERGQAFAGLNLGLDYLFMVAYASAIGLGCVLAARGLFERARGAALIGVALAWGQWVAALLDALENYGLIRVLIGTQAEFWPALARWCAIPKFLIVALGLLYVIVGGIAALAVRRRGA